MLQKSPVETQGSLVAALTSAGYSATQSSVSRDLRELGAIGMDNDEFFAHEGDLDAARELVDIVGAERPEGGS